MAIDDYITARDLGQVANALNIVTMTNNSAEAEQRAHDIHQRRISALDEADRFNQDQDAALTYMQAGMEIPKGMDLSPKAVAGAKGIYAGQRQADATISTLDRADAIRARENEILAEFSKWDGKPAQFFQGLTPDDTTDMQALLNIRKGLLENDRLNFENMQQLKKTAGLMYEQHQGHVSMANKYLQAGNMQMAEKALMSAVNDVPHPVYMEKNAQGNYDLYLEEPGKEKIPLSQGANLTLQQAAQLVQSIPPEQAIPVLAMDMEAAQIHNANAKPTIWRNPAGDAVEVYQFVNPQNPRDMQVAVFEKDGGRLDGLTIDSLRGNGYRPEADLDTQIKQANLREANAKANGAENQASGDAPRDYKALNQQLDNYKKSMALVLAPWTKGNEDMANMDFSDSGTGPLKLAADHYENNLQAFRSGALKGQDLEKFQNAAEAMRLHGMIRQTVSAMHGFEGPAAEAPDHVAEASKLAQAGDQEGLQNYLMSIEDRNVRKQVMQSLRSAAQGQKRAPPGRSPGRYEKGSEQSPPGRSAQQSRR